MSTIARRLAKLEAARPVMAGSPSGDSRALAERCPDLLTDLDYHEVQAWLFAMLKIGSASPPSADALIPPTKRDQYHVNPKTGTIEPIEPASAAG